MFRKLGRFIVVAIIACFFIPFIISGFAAILVCEFISRIVYMKSVIRAGGLAKVKDTLIDLWYSTKKYLAN